MYMKRKKLIFSKFAEEDRMAIEAWVDVDDESFVSDPPASDCAEQASTTPEPSELAGPPDEETSDRWSETDMEENERERMALNAWDNMVLDRMRIKEVDDALSPLPSITSLHSIALDKVEGSSAFQCSHRELDRRLAGSRAAETADLRI